MKKESIIGVIEESIMKMNDIDSDDMEFVSESNLLEDGYIDSMGLVKLVSRLEKNFGVQFSNEDFTRNDFATINGLVSIIEEKL